MINIICVIGKNKGIGCDNKLLWHLPNDLKHFKEITIGHPVIMGRKTYESIGRPLPGRKNIIVTRDKEYRPDGVEVVNSLDEVLEAHKKSDKIVFIIGGGQIYKQALPYSHRLYLTVVDDEPDADTFFPDFSDFEKIYSSEEKEENGVKYRFEEYVKNS